MESHGIRNTAAILKGYTGECMDPNENNKTLYLCHKSNSHCQNLGWNGVWYGGWYGV